MRDEQRGQITDERGKGREGREDNGKATRRMHGWMGKGLIVDLTYGDVEEFSLDEKLLRDYLGGRGLGARLLYELVGPEVDPLCEDNVMVFATGPLTGTNSPTPGKYSLSSKSPLTGTIFDANSGGVWGVKFKKCGYDVLIVKGRAESPVYLKVVDEQVEIKDASHLWGKDVHQTTEELLESEGKQFGVMCIGPAGERLVRIAAIMNEKNRALGRGGLGAVMGSKNLKAIVANGSYPITFAEKELNRIYVYESNKWMKAHPITSKALPEYGTNVMMNLINALSILPTRNFQQTQFDGAEKISGEAVAEQILVKKASGCYACIIQCTRKSKTEKMDVEGPEYESAWSFGADCGIDDLVAVAEAHQLCNIYGMDTISVGCTIACAMELTERGIANLGISFGESHKLADYVRMIAYREGVGDELAEGSLRLARKYGTPEYSMTVKGLDMTAYDPRGAQGMGLVYATSNRGACHLRGGYTISLEVLGVPRKVDRYMTSGKGSYCARLQDFGAVIDSLGVCRFSTFAVNEQTWARLLTAVTGHHFTSEDLMKIGERIWNIERLFNLREGFTRADDTLPPRLLHEPATSRQTVVNLDEMLEEYYHFRGWDENGVPTPEKLKELGLEELANRGARDARELRETRELREIRAVGMR